MKYGVKIPEWHLGESLTILVNAENKSDAYQKAVDWVNKYAGYKYCDTLPIDTNVELREDS